MIEFSESEVLAYYRQRFPDMLTDGKGAWRAPCPVHQGKDKNLHIDYKTGRAYCHSQCGRGWDMISLEMDSSGCNFPKAKDRVFEIVGRPKPQGYDRNIQAVYDYTDASGKRLYQVVKEIGLKGKDFKQRREDNGKWVWEISGVDPVPFQLPLLAKAQIVAIVEGEKCALALTRAGIVATCNSGGAGNFNPKIAPYFAGKDVWILPDNDEAGRNHALKVAPMLNGIAASIRVVEIPGLPLKGDVVDFLDKDGTVEQLIQFAEDSELWYPGWKFKTFLPSEEDKYIRTFGQFLEEIGGMEEFWKVPVGQGVATPYAALTEKLAGGMRPGEVYVVGGNQGSGKTSLALQFTIHALNHNRGVLLFSMEMGWRDVFQRMAAIQARVDLAEFRRLQKADPQSEHLRDMVFKLRQHTWELNDKALIVSTRSRVTPNYLVTESLRLMDRQRIHLVVVDHMQLMASAGTPRGDYEKFTAISRAVKETAMEIKVPVLLVSQTSRNNSHEKRPELDVDDLRGSGAIEEDAAAVMLLYPDREDKERTMKNFTFASGPVKTWLKLGKNRYGPSGEYLPLLHFKTCTRFDQMGAE